MIICGQLGKETRNCGVNPPLPFPPPRLPRRSAAKTGPRFLGSGACRPSDWSRRAIHSKDSCELVFIRGPKSKIENHPNPSEPTRTPKNVFAMKILGQLGKQMVNPYQRISLSYTE